VRVGFIGYDDTAAVLARGWGEPMLRADSRALADCAAVARRAEIVLLCHEPPRLGDIAEAVAPHARIVVSTLPNTPLEAVRHAYPDQAAYRVAVNRPAQIRRGVIVFAEGPPQAPDHAVRSLFARLGKVIPLEDALVDTAAGVMRESAAAVEAHARDEGEPALGQLKDFLRP
jgi:pyrroline-5-carboxylate reductase